MGIGKNGACESETPDLEVEPGAEQNLDIDKETDLDADANFDLDEDLDIDLDLNDGTESNPDIDDTPETDEASSNVGETSVEINVEELIAELEADRKEALSSEEQSCRKRLEDILEERRVAHELDEIDEFDSTIND